MDKKRLYLLEKAFSVEINSALNGGPHLMQTRQKLASSMVREGLLEQKTIKWNGISVNGYELTHAGRYAYCSTCDNAQSALDTAE